MLQDLFLWGSFCTYSWIIFRLCVGLLRLLVKTKERSTPVTRLIANFCGSSSSSSSIGCSSSSIGSGVGHPRAPSVVLSRCRPSSVVVRRRPLSIGPSSVVVRRHRSFVVGRSSSVVCRRLSSFVVIRRRLSSSSSECAEAAASADLPSLTCLPAWQLKQRVLVDSLQML